MPPRSLRARNRLRREPSALDKYDPVGIWQKAWDGKRWIWVLTPYELMSDVAALKMRLLDFLSPEARALLTEHDTKRAFEAAPTEALKLEIYNYDDTFQQGKAAIVRLYQERMDKVNVGGDTDGSGYQRPNTGGF